MTLLSGLQPESSAASWLWFSMCFLGMLHRKLFQERLEREFDMTVITNRTTLVIDAFTKKILEVL